MTIPRHSRLKFAALAALALFAAALPPARTSAQSSAPAQRPPSPNGKIVFHSDQAGDAAVNDIYTMDADGRHETRLTNNANDDANPVWSPAGDQIAFLSNRRGGYEIFLMNADGSNQRPLRADSPVRSFGSVWSPDGTRMAYPEAGNIFVVEVVAPGGGDSAAAPVDVSTEKAAGSSDIEVEWSPASINKLVIRNSQSCGGCSDLYTMNADGTGRAQLTTGAGFDSSPRWSPAGGLIAYEADRAGDGGRGLYVIDAAGAGPERKLSADLGSFGPPAWSPDGSRVAFVSLMGSGVYSANANDGALTLLSDASGTKSNLFWSPDGSRLAFTGSSNTSFTDVFVVNADGASLRESNYTKTRRADESARSWQRLPTQ